MLRAKSDRTKGLMKSRYYASYFLPLFMYNRIDIKTKIERGLLHKKNTVTEIRAGIEPMGVENAGIRLTGESLAVEVDVEVEKILLFSGIKAYSLSFLMDLERKSRSWQGKHFIFNFMQEICREHFFSILSFGQDEVMKVPLIQYREAD
ncbi:MAG: hypothetical protein K2H52_14745 [Lachnospiraceae bacterium]|nr:hypothetical protein [Lachnospiraceae bacterium]MDE6185419.1 hypothetical protein [Lachnospiraceae bacterium]